MAQELDKDYWESHWQQAHQRQEVSAPVANPYLEQEVKSLTPGSALDAGCGEGGEAIWLAAQGWQVTAADISAKALSRAAEHARRCGAPAERIRWVDADLGAWEPDGPFDLVITNYAHPAIPQLEFYERLSRWVAPGGTLLIVGHLDRPGGTRSGRRHAHHTQDHGPPREAKVTATSVTARLDAARWDIVTAEERSRTLADRAGQAVKLHDVVVRAARRP